MAVGARRHDGPSVGKRTTCPVDAAATEGITAPPSLVNVAFIPLRLADRYDCRQRLTLKSSRW
jgi:hypothetical protein